ncbi:MAG: type II secretion system GspH family protein [Clostridiales bacterium]|nr:type II secretion system GspH family protein [Clostridiales bacterium]
MKIMKIVRSTAGFTMIEIMVALVILGIIIVPLTDSLFRYEMTANNEITQINKQDDVTVLLNSTAADVRRRLDNGQSYSVIKDVYESMGDSRITLDIIDDVVIKITAQIGDESASVYHRIQ